LDEDCVSWTHEAERDAHRLGCGGNPLVRLVATRELPDPEDDIDPGRVLSDLAVVAQSIRSELRHVTEDRDRATSVRALDEMRERGAHRHRIRVPGVVEEE